MRGRVCGDIMEIIGKVPVLLYGPQFLPVHLLHMRLLFRTPSVFNIQVRIGTTCYQ